MKTKHLFYSLALASAFAACTQEELVESPVVKDNLANRPVAGVVEFSTEGVESRFNYEKSNGFELGDVFGLYLMDQYVGNYNGAGADCPGEHPNANDPYWTYQNHWFGMYQFTNTIQSNYPFTYKNEGGKKVWKNDAKLVEGNYFAMFPQNEEALNRRELWHAIDPRVELKEVSSSTANDRKFQNVENQLWLGYNQIYRDATASAEGTMKMDIKMVGAMVPLRLTLIGWQGNDVKLDKISFKNAEGKELPTLAYIEPAGLYQATKAPGADYGWVKTYSEKVEHEGNNQYQADFYDAAKTWTRNRVMQLIRWAAPSERVPYGLDESAWEPAYEYAFDYPANTILYGDVHNGDIITTYLTVPALNNNQDYAQIRAEIYGWKFIRRTTGQSVDKNGNKGDWEYGMLTNKNANGANYSFVLNDEVDVWADMNEETNYYRDVEVRFDNFAWTVIADDNAISSTADMEKMVLGYLSENINKSEVTMTVAPDAAGVEIRQSFIDKLLEISKKQDITINFSGARNGKIYFNQDDVMAIDVETTETGKGLKFNYVSGNNGNVTGKKLTLINKAEQNVPYAFEIPAGVEVINEAELNVAGDINTVINKGEMTVEGVVVNNVTKIAEIAALENKGELTLKNYASVANLDNNDAEVTVNGNATVTTLNNNKPNNTIVSELNVIGGKLNVKNLTNNAKVKVAAAATVNVEEALTNNTVYFENNGTISDVKTVVSGRVTEWYNAALTNSKNAKVENFGTISTPIVNNGTIDNEPAVATGGLTREAAIVENHGLINTYGGIIETLNNINMEGQLFVYNKDAKATTYNEAVGQSAGEIIFVGVSAQHVGENGGNDNRIYQTVENMTVSQLNAALSVTKARNLWLYNDITVGSEAFKNPQDIETIVVKDVVVIKYKNENGGSISFPDATLTVEEGCELSIENALTLTVDEAYGTIHEASGSKLVANNSTVDHNQITVTNGPEFADAVQAVSENGVVRFNDDIRMTADINIAKGMILDLNGHTLYADKMMIVSKGDFIVRNGNIEAATTVVKVDAANEANVSVTIEEDVVINTTVDAVWVTQDNEKDVVINLAGEIYGSSNTDAPVYVNGRATNKVIINVTDGKIISENVGAIYAAYSTEVNISGGYIKGSEFAVEIRAGELNISGGTLIATDSFSKSSNDSGSTITGAAVAVSQHSTQKALSVNISDGWLQGAYALYETDLHGEPTDNITLNITGGKFQCTKAHAGFGENQYSPIDSDNVTGFVSGGIYSSTFENKYFKTHYKYDTEKADGFYQIVYSLDAHL